MSKRIVLVTGSRGWNNEVIVHDALVQLMNENLDAENWTLIHGGCRGADLITAKLAGQLGWKRIQMAVTPADWAKHGKRAGILRNSEMINEHQPHHALAFQIGDSPGTKHCIGELNKYMKADNNRMMEPVRIFRLPE